jgi:hypothetical protein
MMLILMEYKEYSNDFIEGEDMIKKELIDEIKMILLLMEYEEYSNDFYIKGKENVLIKSDIVIISSGIHSEYYCLDNREILINRFSKLNYKCGDASDYLRRFLDLFFKENVYYQDGYYVYDDYFIKVNDSDFMYRFSLSIEYGNKILYSCSFNDEYIYEPEELIMLIKKIIKYE